MIYVSAALAASLLFLRALFNLSPFPVGSRID